MGEVARRWVRVWGVREEAGEGVRLVARCCCCCSNAASGKWVRVWGVKIKVGEGVR